MSYRAVQILPIIWTVAAAVACSPAEGTAPSKRIVAVGDLHADYDNAITTLQLAGLTDAEGHWTGGKTTFVQTGDITDRGPDSKRLIDLLRALVGEAEAAGGRVVPLLGNHEVMNLQGDWRYVTPGDVAQFGGEAARKAALAPDGEYGKWLGTQGIVARVEDTVFVHGGITPRFAGLGVDVMNEQARTNLADPGHAIYGSAGPLWYRGFVEDRESEACPRLRQSLATLGVKRMVVGHTTRKNGRIQVRCSGSLAVIDVGIADYYGAHYAAWEWRDGDTRAHYASGPVDLEDPT